jgi:hypothetical protein
MILGSGRSPGRGQGTSPVFLPGESHGEEPGGLQAKRVAKNWTQLSGYHFYFQSLLNAWPIMFPSALTVLNN